MAKRVADVGTVKVEFEQDSDGEVRYRFRSDGKLYRLSDHPTESATVLVFIGTDLLGTFERKDPHTIDAMRSAGAGARDAIAFARGVWESARSHVR